MRKKIVPDKKIPIPKPRKIKPKVLSPQAAVISAEKIGMHNLKAPHGAHKPKKLLGRGSGSGHGKTSTRGSKGQTSRAGRHFYLGFEGGQSPLIRRIPKRGFTSKFKKVYQIVNLSDLSRIKDVTLSLETLQKGGLIKNKDKLVKVLGGGEIKNPIFLQTHAISKNALDKINNAGGKVEIISLRAYGNGNLDNTNGVSVEEKTNTEEEKHKEGTE